MTRHNADPLVVLLRPSTESDHVERLAGSAKVISERLGHPLTTYRTQGAQMQDERPERWFQFLQPLDAHALYRALHRHEVLVMALTQVYVRRDASQTRPARRATVTLEEFVHYKGLFGLIRGDRDPENHLARFEETRSAAPGCLGGDDPRVLPFQTFEASTWKALEDPDRARRFQHGYGPASSRTDDAGKTWRRARRGHGLERLAVSGYLLERGTHWDVTTGGGTALLRNSHEVWQLKSGSRD